MRYVQGSSNSHKRIDPKAFYQLKIPLLHTEDSTKIVSQVRKFEGVKNAIIKLVKHSKSLQKSLINRIF